MAHSALFFGGIGTILETSELQRKAFNAAFAEAGLDWHWDSADYSAMLAKPGGASRVADYARVVGATGIDAVALHARKTALFHDVLSEGGLSARPGVARLVGECADQNVMLGFVSTTDRDTLAAILEAADIDAAAFTLITHRGDVDNSKPSGDIYRFALDKLGVAADQAVAIEDSESGLRAALEAGLRCIVTPGDNTREQDYSGAEAVLASLGDAGKPAEILAGAVVPRGEAFTLADCFETRAA